MTSDNGDVDYNLRYVAFIDVLGFSDLVLEADVKPELRRGIVWIIRKLRETLSENQKEDFKVTQFSDCIVLSALPTTYGLHLVFTGVRMLFENLVQRNVLLRGGICLGNAVHDSETLFGPALVTAYKLDRPGSPPRITLDATIVDNLATSGLNETFNYDIEHDHADGTAMLHTLRDFENYGPPYKPGMLVLDEPARWIGHNIHFWANSPDVSPAVRSKWQWMECYWDRSVRKRGILPLAAEARLPKN